MTPRLAGYSTYTVSLKKDKAKGDNEGGFLEIELPQTPLVSEGLNADIPGREFSWPKSEKHKY
jgi:hypothetical protein